MKIPDYQKNRRAISESYLGKTVRMEVDRPIGYVHHKQPCDIIYPINYGLIPGVLGGDGEELDVYLLGVDKPVSEYEVRIIAVVERSDDVEDKLVGVPVGLTFTKEEIEKAVDFQEKYHQSVIVMADKE